MRTAIGAVDRQGRRERRDAAARQGRSGDLSRLHRKRRRRDLRPTARPNMPAPSVSRRATTRRRSPPATEAAPAEPAKAELPAWRVRGSFALDHARLRARRIPLRDRAAERSLHRRRQGLCRARRRPALLGDCDRRAGALRRGGGRPTRTPAGLTLQDRVAAIRAALLDLPKPSIPGSIDVDLPAVVAGDTTIRDVKMQAEPAAGRLAGQGAVGVAAGTHHARRVGAAQIRRERFRLRRLAAGRRRPAVRVSPPGCRRTSTRRSAGCRRRASRPRSISPPSASCSAIWSSSSARRNSRARSRTTSRRTPIRRCAWR